MTIRLVRTDGGARWRAGGNAMTLSPAPAPVDITLDTDKLKDYMS
ncbi:hypothetical protein [Streptomyces sp. NPDC127114]